MRRSTAREVDWDWHCVDLAAEHYRSRTGKNLWRVLHHRRPGSAKEAASLFRKLGVTNVKDAVTKVLGDPIDPALAMRGDIVLILTAPTGGPIQTTRGEGLDGGPIQTNRGPLIPALGIVRGELIECLDAMQPIARAELAWKLSPFRAND